MKNKKLPNFNKLARDTLVVCGEEQARILERANSKQNLTDEDIKKLSEITKLTSSILKDKNISLYTKTGKAPPRSTEEIIKEQYEKENGDVIP